MLKVVGISYNDQFMIDQAKKAIQEADAIIGHENFIKKVNHMIKENAVAFDKLKSDKNNHDFRLLRCEAAFNLLEESKQVVMLSCGDPGIWGMANYVLDYASQKNLLHLVEVIPGIPAYHHASTKLGTPLMNGFVTISLCDDFFDIKKLRKRLNAAANIDLPCVIYKPKFNAEFYPENYRHESKFSEGPSETAFKLWGEVVTIFNKENTSDLDVAICKNLGDDNESYVFTKLSDILSKLRDFDEKTTIIIGSTELELHSNVWLCKR